MNPLDELKSTLAIRSLDWKQPDYGYKSPPKARHTPFRITGGIGDLILGLGVAEALNDKLGDVVVYSKWPDVVEYFSPLDNYPDKTLTDYGFDFTVYCNSIVKFQIFNGFEGFRNPKLDAVYLHYRNFISTGPWKALIDHHPHLDNALAEEALKRGYNRETLPYAFLGLNFEPRSMGRNMYPAANEWAMGKKLFITVHDGFDGNNTDVKGRSMKNWNMHDWATLVRELKTYNVEVVQLGAANSRKIDGANRTHLGADIKESFKVLRNSSLHIDGDSGLVHAAKIFGTPCVVMFGPTNADFFGYDTNINIKPNFCGNCWWLKLDWMANCPIGYEYPKCMDSITPRMVLDACQRRVAFLK